MIDTQFLEGSQNTPARDFWSIGLEYGLDDTTKRNISLTFLASTGEIDFTRTSVSELRLANTLFSTVNSSLAERAHAQGIKNFDFWKLTNWLIVSFYWTLLADLGQISPTTYAPRNVNSTTDFSVNFSTATRQSSSNNIFVNNTLFTTYAQYLQGTVLPLLGIPIPSAQFAPLDDVNRLHEMEMTIFQNYPCTIRRLKSPLAMLVSVVVTDYAFIKGAYTIFMLGAAWLQKRRYRESKNNFET